MEFTDQRSQTILEALGKSAFWFGQGPLFKANDSGGMRIVKYFSYETPFLESKSILDVYALNVLNVSRNKPSSRKRAGRCQKDFTFSVCQVGHLTLSP